MKSNFSPAGDGDVRFKHKAVSFMFVSTCLVLKKRIVVDPTDCGTNGKSGSEHWVRSAAYFCLKPKSCATAVCCWRFRTQFKGLPRFWPCCHIHLPSVSALAGMVIQVTLNVRGYRFGILGLFRVLWNTVMFVFHDEILQLENVEFYGVGAESSIKTKRNEIDFVRSFARDALRKASSLNRLCGM